MSGTSAEVPDIYLGSIALIYTPGPAMRSSVYSCSGRERGSGSKVSSMTTV